MRDYVIVCFLGESPPTEFSKKNWPLHVTILRPFKTERSVEELTHVLEAVCTKTPVLTLTAKAEEMFGPERNVPVTELEITPELKLLERQVREACESQITFKSDSFPTFRPHVTAQKEGRVSIGEEVILGSLSLVEQGEPYRVVRTYNFGGG